MGLKQSIEDKMAPMKVYYCSKYLNPISCTNSHQFEKGATNMNQ